VVVDQQTALRYGDEKAKLDENQQGSATKIPAMASAVRPF